MGNKISIPKGVKDVLPGESHKWQYVEGVLRSTAKAFNFKEIRLPTFEHTELFCRGVGDTTDVVQKEMYTFEDKGGRSITLRPEGTASVVRSVIENSLYAAALPLKVYYIAPNFRYEKPQAGRFREHHQFGVEYFGSGGPESDAEVIALADTFLKALGIKGIRVSINSIGCPVCRPGYNAALVDYFRKNLSAMCGLCRERIERNPLRLLDCKEEACRAISKDAPHTVDYLCGECGAHFEGLKAALGGMSIDCVVDTRIVRGLDYYTRTVFEFVSDNLGAQATVCGGGRYDRLVETLGGPALCGLGFGSGIERLLMVMEAQGVSFPGGEGPELFVASAGDEAKSAVLNLVYKLRKAGLSAEFDTTGRSLKAQLKYADKLGAGCLLVLGGEEIASGRALLKDMKTGLQSEVCIDADSVLERINMQKIV